MGLSTIFWLGACSNGENDGPATGCEPDRGIFEGDIRPRIERACGSCHGIVPNFGAPVTLSDYQELLRKRPDGTRLVERIGPRIADGSMPPATVPRLAQEDADAIAGWASCGAVTVSALPGVRTSASPALATTTPPAGLATLDFRADEYAVRTDIAEEYRCFVFDAALSEPRFARRFEMVFDETRVLHHLVLLRDRERHAELGQFNCNGGSGMPSGSEYLYAWAPGQGAIDFPAGGLRVSPGERFIVQLHYNNGAGLPDLRDSSGVRLYFGPTEGPEYGMVAMGPTDFSLAPSGTTEVASRCSFPQDMTLLAGMPHMHRLGSAFSQTITRLGGVREPLIELSNWSFDTQLFYSLPTTLRAGDTVETKCTFTNTTAQMVSSGEDTADEMCFNFLYLTPPPAARYCDQQSDDRPADVSYMRGTCAPADAPATLPLVRGNWVQQSAPPALVQGPVAEGRWVLDALEFYVTNSTTPIGNIDLKATYVLARGQVYMQGGELAFDLASDLVLLSDSGVRFGEPSTNSFRVPFTGGTSPAQLPPSCPAGGNPVKFDWGVEGDTLTIGFESSAVPGQTLWPRYRFRRASN